jgi:hypothetical protein
MRLKVREGERERGRMWSIPHSAAVTAKKMLSDARDAPEEYSRPLDQYSVCGFQDLVFRECFGLGDDDDVNEDGDKGLGSELEFGECFDVWDVDEGVFYRVSWSFMD